MQVKFGRKFYNFAYVKILRLAHAKILQRAVRNFKEHGVKFEIPQNALNFKKFHKISRSPEILKAPQI
ncbi:hypothetical protein [uncultured Campylobacter sp.]|uniref:hypothetical protein n=1 Tax=uncultured Campylobacter sp. TaxID=218934 RepID=UPI0025FB6A09|nr:hypothetical protein [uncultured Campylobacter sp.]